MLPVYSVTDLAGLYRATSLALSGELCVTEFGS